MTVVVDASSLTHVLIPTETGERAREVIAGSRLHSPSIVDAESANALRGMVLGGVVEPDAGRRAIDDLARFGVRRHPYRRYLPRAWELRDNFTIYDALYVALAEAIGAPLLTSDGKLAAAVELHTDVATI